MKISMGLHPLGVAAVCAIAVVVASACGHGFDSNTSQQATNTSAATVTAQRSTNQPAPMQGFPYDWSHRHLIFSRPRTAAMAKRLEQEPRYHIQQAWRARQARPGGTEAYMQALDALAVQLSASRTVPVLPPIKWGQPAPHKRLRGDWSVNMGNSAKVGAGRYPAKYSFNASAAPDCTNDFVVFNTSRPGGAGQASVMAFNNLYKTTCASGVPAVYWAYNTSGTVINSVVLSGDGSQVAFIHTPASTAANLVILKWKAGQGTSFSTPASPTMNTTTAATFVTCKSNPANSCELTLAFGNNNNDSQSAPFYDYSNDIIYVGDDAGVLHKFTGVFKGTPGEVTSSPWPATMHANAILTSPVLDSGVTPPVVYVAASTGASGVLDYASTATPGSRTESGILGHNSMDIADAPIVDSVAGKIYVGVGNDGASNSGVFVFNRGFASNTKGTEAIVGAASTTTPLTLYDGDFDNTYYNSANGAGNLYVCGNTGGTPKLYQVPVTATAFGTVRTGPILTSANTTCSPITEIYNSNASGGPFDWIFLSVQGSGSLSNCGGSGCVMNFIVTAWQQSTAYSLNQEILDANLNVQKVTTAGTSGATQPAWNAASGGTTADGTVVWTNQGSMGINSNASSAAEAGGTSGLIIDNTASTTGASQVYFSTLGTGTCGGGCAVQASQSGLQ